MRAYHSLDSNYLQREMEHLVIGWGGAPVLVFPSSKGRFYQWEDFRMVEHLREHLVNGWLQLFCLDSIDHLSWYNLDIHQREQLDWHLAYEDYIEYEFLPHLRQINPTPFLITTGASFGGFHAVNFAIRHPHLVNRAVAMSGDYEAEKYVDGYFDEDVLANSPLDYLSSQSPGSLPPAVRSVEFILASGQYDFCKEPTLQLAANMSRLGIPHQCHIWQQPGMHDWPLWREQVKRYL